MPKLQAVDLSHWNPTPDFAKMKAGGVLGVIHKATEGTSIVDDQLFKRAASALGVGLAWSTYHFLRPGSMSTQMDFYLRTIDPVQGERVCLDHEDGRVSLDDLVDAVGYIRLNRPDLQVTIYSGHLIKEQLGSAANAYLRDNTSLWLAQYTTGTPTWPTATWPQWSLWQFSDRATVPGLTQPADGNAFNGSDQQCLAWFGPVGSVPSPGPEPEPEPETRVIYVDVNVGPVPEGVEVMVRVNSSE